jgi:hypothetical protein
MTKTKKVKNPNEWTWVVEGVSYTTKEMKAITQRDVQTIDAIITKYYGKRCKEQEAYCSCCQVWSVRDTLALFLKVE